MNLVERGNDSPLLQRVAGIRRQLATQLGYLMPPVKVKDNIALRSREYVIQMRGNEIAASSCCKAMNWPFRAEIPTARCKANRRTIRPSDCPRSGSGRIRRTARAAAATRWSTRSASSART